MALSPPPSSGIPSPEAVLNCSQGTVSSQASDASGASKPRKPPSITPRRFNKFFTPRSTSSRKLRNSSSRRALKEITASGNNRSGLGKPKPQKSLNEGVTLDWDDQNALFGSTSSSKRRKTHHVDLYSSPSQGRGFPKPTARASSPVFSHTASSDTESTTEDLPSSKPFRRRGQRSRGLALLDRNIGQAPTRKELTQLNDWKADVRDFYTDALQVHVCQSIREPGPLLPFCTATCNTNPVVAVGDEDGGIRLLDSDEHKPSIFEESFLAFRPHTNAILDLSFSSDDMILATASGDQTCLAIDMPTRRVISTMAGHGASVKQVRFQPGRGENNVIASSGRDGTVQIWDLRCRGKGAPASQIHVNLEEVDEHDRPMGLTPGTTSWARAIRSLVGAHNERDPRSLPSSGSSRNSERRAGRSKDASITSLAFLPAGREHLLLTGSEANASVKLWDLRAIHSTNGKAKPVSTVPQPKNHDRHRSYGINSLAVSSDGARYYSLCRDNTVYAYSTNHLILGHAPELSFPNSRPRRRGASGCEALGPMYGLRHPQLVANSFFVKCSLRRANANHPELLAAGSSTGSPVVFPTDESSLPEANLDDSASCEDEDYIPIYSYGAALIRGHEKEATTVDWTYNGALVSLSDDYKVRCWREGPGASVLRSAREFGGERWNSGWADIPEDDHDDEESDKR